MLKAEPPATQDMIVEILDLAQREITERPPTIGLVGVSGVGKSSTINALFRTRLAMSDTVACTKQFESIDLSLNFVRGQLKSAGTSLRIIDAPGLGEDLVKDAEYLAMYEEHLPSCDVILWVMSARNRAVALDQHYLKQLARFHGRIVFGINQADIVEPMDWRERINLPSRRQESNLRIIEQDRREKLQSVLGRDAPIVCYSSRYGYRLPLLFRTLLEACPPERRWIYEGLRNFNHRDFIPDSAMGRSVHGWIERFLKFLNREEINHDVA
jgi:predicted GTPase